MRNLIKFELRKLFYKKAVYVCGLMISFIIAITFCLFLSDDSLTQGELWQYMIISALPNCAIDIVSPISIAILVCEDYKSGTIRSIINRGYNRNKLYCAKFFTAIISTVILSTFCWISTFVLGAIFLKGQLSFTFQMFLIMLTQLLLILVISTISFFTAILSRKTSLSIISGILFPTIVSLILSLADKLIAKTNFKLSDYWIVSLLSEISNMPIDTLVISKSIIVSCIYISIIFIFGMVLFNKQDL